MMAKHDAMTVGEKLAPPAETAALAAGTAPRDPFPDSERDDIFLLHLRHRNIYRNDDNLNVLFMRFQQGKMRVTTARL